MNYTVQIEADGVLSINPPIGKIDGEPITTVFLIKEVGFGKEVLAIRTKKDAIVALYDEYQTSDVLKDGDTFTLKGEEQPFAYASGVHILPMPSRSPEVPLPPGFATTIEGVIEGYHTEFSIWLRKREDCSEKFWLRMGAEPFYEVRLYDRYLGSGISGYIKPEQLKSLLSRLNL